MALTPIELTALAAIRASFAHPAFYQRSAAPAFPVSIIPSEDVSNEVDGPGDHGRRRSFELPFSHISGLPERGDILLFDASTWVVIDFTERRDVDAWQLYIVEQDRFDGNIIVERGIAQDDGYTSGEVVSWAPLISAIAVVIYGSGEEQREAAREVCAATTTMAG